MGRKDHYRVSRSNHLWTVEKKNRNTWYLLRTMTSEAAALEYVDRLKRPNALQRKLQ